MTQRDLEAELCWYRFSPDFYFFVDRWDDRLTTLEHTLEQVNEYVKAGIDAVSDETFGYEGTPEIEYSLTPVSPARWFGSVNTEWLRIFSRSTLPDLRFGVTKFEFDKILKFVSSSVEEQHDILIQLELSQ